MADGFECHEHEDDDENPFPHAEMPAQRPPALRAVVRIFFECNSALARPQRHAGNLTALAQRFGFHAGDDFHGVNVLEHVLSRPTGTQATQILASSLF